MVNESIRYLDTSVGPSRITLVPGNRGSLVLGHGAGGLRWSADLLAVRDAARAAQWGCVLVDQPWRVAGRRVAARPPVLDTAWRETLAELGDLPRPLVVGGRSAGARVACRTSGECRADAVLCLSFPVHPPGKPHASRADELRVPILAGLPVRVIQGAADPFGTPNEVRAELPDGGDVVEVAGNHSLRATVAVAGAALEWLTRLASQ